MPEDHFKVLKTQELLDNPVFQEVVENLKAETVKEWVLSETVEEREKKHSEMKGLLKIQQELEQRIVNFNFEALQSQENEDNQETE